MILKNAQLKYWLKVVMEIIYICYSITLRYCKATNAYILFCIITKNINYARIEIYDFKIYYLL